MDVHEYERKQILRQQELIKEIEKMDLTLFCILWCMFVVCMMTWR